MFDSRQPSSISDQRTDMRPRLTSMHRMGRICPHPSPLPEGEGTLMLGAADGGVFALGGERVGVDGRVVDCCGIGELLERVWLGFLRGNA